MTGYYDYVLLLIPGVLLGTTAALALFGISLSAAVPVGGGASTLVVAHALFVNGPVADEEPTAAATAPNAPASAGPAPNAD